MGSKTFQLAETGNCPYCDSDLIQDNRTRLTPVIGWMVVREYECGTAIGGLIGTPLVAECICDHRNHMRKVTGC